MKNTIAQQEELEDLNNKKTQRHNKYVFIIDSGDSSKRFIVSRKTFYDAKSNYPQLLSQIKKAFYN